MKRVLSLVLTLALLLAMMPVAFAASDISGHWAETYYNYLITEGVFKANASTGKYEPSTAVVRAEFMRYINRAFHFTEKATISFTDVSDTSAWYYEPVQIAVKHGYIDGVSSTQMNPNGKVTREQAVVILGRLFKTEVGDVTPTQLNFKDNSKINTWSAPYIKAAVDAGYITGLADGTFNPQGNVTRAEIAAMLYRYLGTSLSTSGKAYIGSNLKADTSNVTISEPCTLADALINGDLYIFEGVKSGAVTLKNVTVKGRIVQCGGEVTYSGVTAENLVLSSPMNRLLFATATGITRITNTSIRSSASLFEKELTKDETEYGFYDVTMNGAGTPSATIDAAVNDVTVQKGASIATTSTSSIHMLTCKAATVLTGYGTVEEATINATGCNLSIMPDNGFTMKTGVTAVVAGNTVTESYVNLASLNPSILKIDLGDTSYSYKLLEFKTGDPAEVKQVICDNKLLTDFYDYAVRTDGLRLYREFLTTLSAGSHTLQVKMNNGATAKATITISADNVNSLSETEWRFDQNSSSKEHDDLVVTLSPYNSATLKKVVLGATELSDASYSTKTKKVTIDADEMDALYPGTYTLTFVMTTGVNPTITLTVVNTGRTNDTDDDEQRSFLLDYFPDLMDTLSVTVTGVDDDVTVKSAKCGSSSLTYKTHYRYSASKNGLTIVVRADELVDDGYLDDDDGDTCTCKFTLSNGEVVTIKLTYRD